jgi:CysZ protein
MAEELVVQGREKLACFPKGASRIALVRFGLGGPWRGFRYLLGNRELWPWIFIPVLINVVLIGGAYWGASWAAPLLLGALWPMPTGGFAFTVWQTVAMGVGLLLFVLGVVFLYALSGIVGTPFYDYLTARVEAQVAGLREEDFDWTQFRKDVMQSIGHSLLAFGLWLSVMIPLACVGLIPGLGQLLELVLGLSFTSLFLAREMMDGAMSRRRYSFRYKLRVVRSQWLVMLGFGGACAVLLWIPLANFLFMPVSVVGGTLLFLDLEDSSVLPF